MKTNELTGHALDWVVTTIEAEREGWHKQWVLDRLAKGDVFNHKYSEYWDYGGPIIEREQITVIRCDDDYGTDSEGFCNNKRIPVWGATIGQHQTNTCYEGEHFPPQYELDESSIVYGPTPLISAMRCYVASKLGDEIAIEIPEEPEEFFE